VENRQSRHGGPQGDTPDDGVGDDGGPLYAKITASLALKIRRGEFAPGAPLPSERALAEQYGVSSITARRVMSELSRRSLVERRQGAGTFVRKQAGRKRVVFLVLEFKEAPVPDHRMIPSAFGELVGGIAQVTWQVEASLGLGFVREPDELAAWLQEARLEDSCDGLVVRAAGDVTSEEIDLLDSAGLPYVVVKRHPRDRVVPCVIADERRAVRLATEHLLALGHQAIGLIASTQAQTLYEERVLGYQDALRSAGVDLQPSLLCDAPDFSVASGETAARQLLGQPRTQRPTALMVASDSMAMGAYQAAAHWGISIPQDLSIASVDDIAEAATLQPPLTTVRMSHVDFGVRAMELLLTMIDAQWRGEPQPPRVDVIEPHLVLRESTAPPRR
jgi:DNA-binding LacI/PurR family transcriptional regulator